jgi:hypothetical protein
MTRSITARECPRKVQATVEERRDGDLVGCVEGRRGRATRLGGRTRHHQRGKSLQCPGASKSRRAAATRSSDSTPEPIRSGQPRAWAIGVRMSGIAELREDRAVHVLHHGMHEALRMYDHADSAPVPSRTARRLRSARGPLFISVAESTEILRPMRQRGCAQACVGRDCLGHLLERGAQEWSARGREQDAPHAFRCLAGLRASRRHALEDRVVFAVDRHQRRPAGAARRRPAARRPRTSDSLFATSTCLPARGGGERGRQPRRTDDRSHHGVDLARRRTPRSSAWRARRAPRYCQPRRDAGSNASSRPRLAAPAAAATARPEL